MTTSASPAAPLPQLPATQLPTAVIAAPPGLDKQIADALVAAAEDAAAFSKTHAVSEEWKFPAYALDKLPFPPSDAVTSQELAVLHREMSSRTPQETQAAVWYNAQDWTMWDTYLKDYEKRVTPKQAAAAEKLLHDVEQQVSEQTAIAKANEDRTRPYVQDTTITTAVEKPGNNPSYPSGHTSFGIAGAIVDSYLMPDRANEFMTRAEQVGYSRVYAGVHFPSDVVAGARLGATIADYMAQNAVQAGTVRQVKGTKHH